MEKTYKLKLLETLFSVFLKENGIEDDAYPSSYWKDQVASLKAGVRDGSMHDASLQFTSWLRYNYGMEV